MRKVLDSVLLPTFTLVASLFAGTSFAASANEPIILTEENAADLGIDFQKAQARLNDAGIQVQSAIGIKFHEETNQVDLSGLDSFSIVVDLDEVASVPLNGDLDGGQGF